MKKDTINYFTVGTFVLVTALLLFAMLVKIAGTQSDIDVYYVYFKKITGIKDGAAVSYGGYQLGQVNNISPEYIDSKTLYKLELAIKGGWHIPADSVAQIITPGIVSDKQVEISEGKSLDKLNPGDTITAHESVDVMALADSLGRELGDVVPNLAANVARLLAKLNDNADRLSLMLSDKNIQRADRVFRNADEASANFARLASGFDNINQQLNQLLQQSTAIVDDNDDDIRYAVLELRNSLETVSTNLHSIIHNLDSSAQNMNEFTRQIRANPGILLGSKPAIDTAEQN